MDIDMKHHLSQMPIQHWIDICGAPSAECLDWSLSGSVQISQDLYLSTKDLDFHQQVNTPITSTVQEKVSEKQMERFPFDKVNDFKHVIYNMLVDNHNNPKIHNFIRPCTVVEGGVMRHGFCFNEEENPDKRLPEMYAQHIRKARLDLENQQSAFIQDLYKFYLRACVELLSKYFEKRDKYTYLYEDIALFVPNSSLEEAEERIKNMKSRARKKRKAPSAANY